MNPARIDPTRTTMLRRAFVLEMRRRFEKLKRALVSLVEGEDAFGLVKLSANEISYASTQVNLPPDLRDKLRVSVPLTLTSQSP